MARFKVGDIVRAKINRDYYITDHNTLCKVINVYSDGTMSVRAIEGDWKNIEFGVIQSRFTLEIGKTKSWKEKLMG